VREERVARGRRKDGRVERREKMGMREGERGERTNCL
jgi:hypothetical protein